MVAIIVCAYFILGIIAIYVSAFIHLVQAEFRGYDALKFWNELLQDLKEEITFIKFLFGLFIWPIRFVEFWDTVPKLYNSYEFKN